MSLPENLEGALVTGTSGEPGTRIYVIEDGEKRWILSPEVFAERGWKFEDVITLANEDLAAIPTSDQVVGEHLRYAPRDRVRQHLAAPYLSGVGIELGPGPYPHRLPEGATARYFDLRDSQELARFFGPGEQTGPVCEALEAIPKRFPNGADFLIAHNVLEHCADPIDTLIEWAGHVRDGGVIVISVPHVDFCADKGRLVPDIEHVLFDFLLSRGAQHFESREHAYSCGAGWMNTWKEWQPLDKHGVAEGLHAMAHASELDVHWHAFDPKLFDQLIQVASRFASRPFHPMAWADPASSTHITVGDIIAVLRVGGGARSADIGFRFADVSNTLADARSSLVGALGRLDTSPVRYAGPTPARLIPNSPPP